MSGGDTTVFAAVSPHDAGILGGCDPYHGPVRNGVHVGSTPATIYNAFRARPKHSGPATHVHTHVHICCYSYVNTYILIEDHFKCYHALSTGIVLQRCTI